LDECVVSKVIVRLFNVQCVDLLEWDPLPHGPTMISKHGYGRNKWVVMGRGHMKNSHGDCDILNVINKLIYGVGTLIHDQYGCTTYGLN
jgi:hypothetical protein